MKTWRSDDGSVTLYCADCREVLSALDPVETCITDPPYGLSFMGKEWDHGVPGVPFWEAILRVLKPGAMLLAFGGTRTHHRLMVAIEDGGFEIRDCLMWLYGTGFPKSLDISKAIDKAADAEREVIRVEDRRSEYDGRERKSEAINTRWREAEGRSDVRDVATRVVTAPATDEAKLWDGWGTALKPAWEPIILAMKPLDGTFAQNAIAHGVAGLNIDGCRIGTESTRRPTGTKMYGKDSGWNNHNMENMLGGSDAGRWPANVVLDEEAGKLLDGEGGASRFFYCAKASRRERTAGGTVENKHPTVKPVALMRWFCRLAATPTGGTVFDPFMGTGSTGVAAVREGRGFVGIERDEKSFEVAVARIRDAGAYPDEELDGGEHHTARGVQGKLF